MRRRTVRRRIPRRRAPGAALAAVCATLLVIGVQTSNAQSVPGVAAAQVRNTASHSVTIRVPTFAALVSGGIVRTSTMGQSHRVVLHGNQAGLTVSTSTTNLGLSLRVTHSEHTMLLATADTQPVATVGTTNERRRNGERAFEILDRSDEVVYVTVTRR